MMYFQITLIQFIAKKEEKIDLFLNLYQIQTENIEVLMKKMKYFLKKDQLKEKVDLIEKEVAIATHQVQEMKKKMNK